jgi:hypothetical protein
MAKKRHTTKKRGTAKKKPPHHQHHQHHHHALYGAYAEHSTQERIMHAAVETGKDVLGIIGGGLLGAAIGKSSLFWGIGATGLGYYIRNRWVQVVGTGMIASNGFQSSGNTTNGLDGLDGAKERIAAYQQSFSQKFYIDKFLKKKAKTATVAADAGTSGIGEVQYFTYPDALTGDLAALSDIENQLAQSALTFQGNMGGNQPEIALEPTGNPLADVQDDRIGDVDDMLY